MVWFNNDLLFVATYDPHFETSRNDDGHSGTNNVSSSRIDSKWNLFLFDRRDIIQHYGSRNGMPNPSSIAPDATETTHYTHLQLHATGSNSQNNISSSSGIGTTSTTSGSSGGSGSGGIGSSSSQYFKPLLCYPLTNHPIGMESIDGEKLLIYFVDGVIHVYDININFFDANHKSFHYYNSSLRVSSVSAVTVSGGASSSSQAMVTNSIADANSQRPSMSLGPAMSSIHGLSMSSPKMGLSEEFETDFDTSHVNDMANDILNGQFDASSATERNSGTSLGNSNDTRMQIHGHSSDLDTNIPNNSGNNGSFISYLFGSSLPGSSNFGNAMTKPAFIAYSLKNYCVLAPFQTLSPHPVSIRLWKNDLRMFYAMLLLMCWF